MARLNLHANLRQTAGRKFLELAPGRDSTVRELLLLAIADCPALEKELFDPSGALLPRTNLLLNGRNVLYIEGQLDAPVKPNDILDAFPPVAGG
ncbi:MAG: ubiquitin-like small modifier protein 1 [Planctomycetota bacterium]